MDGAELAVGPDLAIELPPPSGGRPPSSSDASRPSAELLAAGRPRAEIEPRAPAAREEAERLGRELERLRATHATRVEELQKRIGAEREEVIGPEGGTETARATYHRR